MLSRIAGLSKRKNIAEQAAKDATTLAAVDAAVVVTFDAAVAATAGLMVLLNEFSRDGSGDSGQGDDSENLHF